MKIISSVEELRDQLSGQLRTAFVPTQAAMSDAGTDTPSRRCIHAAAASRYAAEPIDAG